MKIKTIYIFLFLFIISCGANEEPIVEEIIPEPKKPRVKYRTYKRIVPMIKTDRMNIERTTDIQDARRYILKTFDGYKPGVSSKTNSK